MLELLKALDAFVWGPPLLILLVGTGIYLTIRLGLLQVTRLPKAFQLIFTKDSLLWDGDQVCRRLTGHQIPY